MGVDLDMSSKWASLDDSFKKLNFKGDKKEAVVAGDFEEGCILKTE